MIVQELIALLLKEDPNLEVAKEVYDHIHPVEGIENHEMVKWDDGWNDFYLRKPGAPTVVVL